MKKGDIVYILDGGCDKGTILERDGDFYLVRRQYDPSKSLNHWYEKKELERTKCVTTYS